MMRKGSGEKLLVAESIEQLKACVKLMTADRDSDVDEGTDIGNGLQLDNVRKFWYLVDMLKCGGEANSASVTRVHCA